MNTVQKNRFEKEVEAAASNNANVDMDQVREWQRIVEFLDRVSHLQALEQEKPNPPRLQPIPLKLFDCF